MVQGELAKATLVALDGRGKERPETKVEAQFNPASLRISYRFVGPGGSVAAGAKPGEAGSAAAQTNQRTDYRVSLSALELLLDTTQTGEDVRQTTLKIAEHMLLLRDRQVAPTVRFQWGSFLFQGTIDSLDETLDYFSAQGVPLRASVTIAMSMTEERRKDQSGAGAGAGLSAGASAGLSAGFSASASAGFSASASASISAGVSASAGLSASASFSAGAAVGTMPLTLAASGESVQSIAGRAGVDWKVVASANGIDNPRQLQAGAVLNLNAKTSRGGG